MYYSSVSDAFLFSKWNVAYSAEVPTNKRCKILSSNSCVRPLHVGNSCSNAYNVSFAYDVQLLFVHMK